MLKVIFYRSPWNDGLTTEGRIIFSTLIYHSIYENARYSCSYNFRGGLDIEESLEDAVEGRCIPLRYSKDYLRYLTRELNISAKTMKSCMSSIEGLYLSEEFDENTGGVVTYINIPNGLDLQSYFRLKTDSKLRGNDLLLYSWMRFLVDDRGNKTCTINKSISDLSGDLNMAEGTIKDSLTRLKKVGLIERIYIGKSNEVVKSRIKVYHDAIAEDKRQLRKHRTRKVKKSEPEPPSPINVPAPADKTIQEPENNQESATDTEWTLF